MPPQHYTGADQRDLDREQECNPELSGGILISFKEVRWTNEEFWVSGCPFELEYLKGLETAGSLMTDVAQISREGGSCTSLTWQGQHSDDPTIL